MIDEDDLLPYQKALLDWFADGAASDTITLIAPTGLPAKVIVESGARGQVIVDDPFAHPATIHSIMDLETFTDFAEHEERWLALLLSQDMNDEQLRELVSKDGYDEARRIRREYVLMDETEMKKMPFIPRGKPHNGQPRSLKETRRAQRKGGKRR